MKRYTYLYIVALLALMLGGCREEDFVFYGPETYGSGDDIPFEVEVVDFEGNDATRTITTDSKKQFSTNEIIHIRAEYDCEVNGVHSTKIQYGIYKYAGRGIWNPFDTNHRLIWPDDAKTGKFYAYYLYGSNGVLSENTMEPKLLSEYKYAEVPLYSGEVNCKYGHAVKFQMKHVFSHLTLTDMQDGISDQLWFVVPADREGVYSPKLNNAFRLKFDPQTFQMTQEFLQVPSTTYSDTYGNPLVYINAIIETVEVNDVPTTLTSFFLEPNAYHKFNILYPRTRTTYATYLTYDRDLSALTETRGLVANGRYVFSILKSLGVVVEETPDDGWDDEEPYVIVDVEKFLRAVNSGSDYYEHDDETDQDVQILESTLEGTRLLRNVDFRYFYYDVFEGEGGVFRPVQNLTFDGNYHYIYHMGCPLFYQNDGIIINLGIRDVSTANHPILSSENVPRGGQMEDLSYNGIIASRNNGTVDNVRVSNIDMKVQVQTTDVDDPTQEAHNVSLLFGVNRGHIYDIRLAGTLKLTVENYPSNTVIPRVSIGGLAGQNLLEITGVSYIDDDGFTLPDVQIFNTLQGANGAYKVGGLAGNNTGTLDDIFISNITIDGSRSSGLESYLGGLVGDNPSSPAGSPYISNCIIRGEVKAGTVSSITNLNSLSYAGGVAGAFNLQASLLNSSISVGVTGSPNYDRDVEYAEGGMFGIMTKSAGTLEGSIQTIACYGSKLTGNGYIGNFAGIVPEGFGWDHYKNNGINIRKIVNDNIGIER